MLRWEGGAWTARHEYVSRSGAVVNLWPFSYLNVALYPGHTAWVQGYVWLEKSSTPLLIMRCTKTQLICSVSSFGYRKQNSKIMKIMWFLKSKCECFLVLWIDNSSWVRRDYLVNVFLQPLYIPAISLCDLWITLHKYCWPVILLLPFHSVVDREKKHTKSSYTHIKGKSNQTLSPAS